MIPNEVSKGYDGYKKAATIPNTGTVAWKKKKVIHFYGTWKGGRYTKVWILTITDFRETYKSVTHQSLYKRF